jgi:hypothetical protein
MPTVDDVAATLANEPELWWGHARKHGWVVLDRDDETNSDKQRYLVRCQDWSGFFVPRKEFGTDQFVWFKKYLGDLPADKQGEACAQLLTYRQQYASKKWFAYRNPKSMLTHLKAASVRKGRLFAIACCRHVWHLMDFDDCRQAVQLAERLVEGEATAEEAQRTAEQLKQTMESLDPTFRGPRRGVRAWSLWSARKVLADAEPRTPDRPSDSSFGVLGTRESVMNLISHASVTSYDNPPPRGPQEAEERAQAELVREVLGNPYRLVAFAERWRTADVLFLAQAIYADRAFDQTAILADALEEAGCNSAELLDHLRRQSSAHVRGCWALDVVLGRR